MIKELSPHDVVLLFSAKAGNLIATILLVQKLCEQYKATMYPVYEGQTPMENLLPGPVVQQLRSLTHRTYNEAQQCLELLIEAKAFLGESVDLMATHPAPKVDQ